MSIIKGTNQIVAGFGGTKRSIGEVYFSQSALATDNSGALPLFTGETIASANTIYPEFYNWVSAHTELQCTAAEYESALTTYGECPKYVVINSTPTRYKWENPTTGVLYTLSRNPAVGDLAYDVTGNSSWPITEASSTKIVVPTFADNKPFSYVEEVAGTSASIRLPKLSNYIKAANPSEGIKNIEAGLPNIDSDTNWVNVTSGTETTATNTNVLSDKGAFGGTNSQGGHGIKGNDFPINWRRFDASLSNSIYGKSSTVTPASTTLYPWVVAYTAAIPASTAQAAEFQQGLSGKADTSLSNTTPSQSFKEMSVGWDMPDYSSAITGNAAAGKFIQCPADAAVCVFGSDSYIEDFYAYVSPDNGTTKYIVGRRTDDVNSNTQTTSFYFLVPKNWYFTTTVENGFTYQIYPLSGGQNA